MASSYGFMVKGKRYRTLPPQKASDEDNEQCEAR